MPINPTSSDGEKNTEANAGAARNDAEPDARRPEISSADASDRAAAELSSGDTADGDIASGGDRSMDRASDRHSIFMHGDLQLSYMDGPETVRIRNLSSGGMMAETPLPARTGEELIISLPNIGPVRGRVAWVMEGRFGVQFDLPVDPHQVRRKVAVTKPAPSPFERGPDAVGRGRPGFKR